MIIQVNDTAALLQAIDLAAEKKAEICLEPGRYELPETLDLGPGLSGTKFTGEGAVLSGGTLITGADLREDSLVRIPAKGLAPCRLYVNGAPRRRATWPAEGFFETDGSHVLSGWANEVTEEDDLNRGSIVVKKGDLPDDLPEDAEFVILQYWGEARLHARSVDRENSCVYFTGKSWRPLYWSFGWYIDNHPHGLTVPGTWYLDRARDEILYRPLPGEDPKSLTFEVPRLTTLVCMDTEGGKGATFEGITFSCTDARVPEEGHSTPQAELTAPSGIVVSHAKGGSFTACRFENLGGYALDLSSGSKDIAVSRCCFEGCGAGAVRIGETVSPVKACEEASGNSVTNCLIRDCGTFYLGSCGIWVGHSPENTIVHNEITGALQWAISVGWAWSVFPVGVTRGNRISYNFIHELGTGILGTHGALYCLGTSPETVVDHNYIRNVYSNKYWGAGEGIILDNGCTGISIRDNIVTGASAGGWGCNFNCFGCVICNNIFAFGEKFQLTRYGDAPSGDEPAPNGEIFTRNIVLCDDAPMFKEEDWYAYSTYWDYNLYFDRKGPIRMMRHTPEEWQALGLDRHSVFADPEFVDIDRENFTLMETSPAIALGFVPIDTRGIGILPRGEE